MKKQLKNKFEKKLHSQLKKAKVNFKYESEKIPYVFAGHYIPDFVLQVNGQKRYIEAKGYFRPEHKRKMAAVKKLHPAMDIRIVFYSFDKRNVRWAEKNGFPYSIGQIPENGLNEQKTIL